MDGISSAVAANALTTQMKVALEVLKETAESQQAVVAMLGQVAGSSNPDYLGQALDTFA